MLVKTHKENTVDEIEDRNRATIFKSGLARQRSRTPKWLCQAPPHLFCIGNMMIGERPRQYSGRPDLSCSKTHCYWSGVVFTIGRWERRSKTIRGAPPHPACMNNTWRRILRHSGERGEKALRASKPTILLLVVALLGGREQATRGDAGRRSRLVMNDDKLIVLLMSWP
jgi:hypothetical protein